MTLEKHTTYIQIVFNKFSTVFTLQDLLNLRYRIHRLKAITLGLEHLWILVSAGGPLTPGYTKGWHITSMSFTRISERTSEEISLLSPAEGVGKKAFWNRSEHSVPPNKDLSAFRRNCLTSFLTDLVEEKYPTPVAFSFPCWGREIFNCNPI